MKFTIYEIEKCGFYERGSNTANFGTIGDWWNSFVQWTQNRNISETKTWQLGSDDNQDVEDGVKTLASYCSNAFTSSSNEGFGLVLWNQIPSSENGVLTIDGTGTVGSTNAGTTDIERNKIAGWPAHFWIRPVEKIIVSLLPEQNAIRSSGIRELEKYFSNFLKTYSEYSMITQDDGGVNRVEGWRETPESEVFNCYPKFKAKRIMLPGELAYIRSKVRNIYKYVSHANLSIREQEHRNLVQRFWESRNIKSDQNNVDVIKFNVEISWTPTIDDLNEAIDAMTGNPGDTSGVKISGDNNVWWFHRIWASDKLNLVDDLDTIYQWNKGQLDSVWRQSKTAVLEKLSRRR